MQQKKVYAGVAIVLFAMLVLMIDGNSAILGARNGIELCNRVIIPSIFPFFFLSVWLNHLLPRIQIPGLRYIAKLTQLPEGSEGLLLIGLIGGYPVGAQCVTDTWKQQQISTKQAKRMLGFCSNAGPAFIFGVCRILFSSPIIPWTLWSIHICSAILTGILLPSASSTEICLNNTSSMNFSQAMKRSLLITASVCGWVILFKTVLQLLTPITEHSQFLYHLFGTLELSNGILQLNNISSEAIRYILCSAYLGFGGICVYMQTYSITEDLHCGCYLYGKFMQTLISIILASTIAIFLFHSGPLLLRIIASSLILAIIVIPILRKCCKKSCGNYNKVDV